MAGVELGIKGGKLAAGLEERRLEISSLDFQMEAGTRIFS